MRTVAENRSELGDRLGQAIRPETGFKKKPAGVLRTDLRRRANCVTDREKSTTQIDYGCRLVDDRVPADRERVASGKMRICGSLNR